jgi:hypothetical protein
MRFNKRSLFALVPLAVLPTAPMGVAAHAHTAPSSPVAVTVPVAPRAFVDGFVVTERVTVKSEDPAAQAAGPITLHIKVSGGKIRLDMEMAELAQMGGMYMLPKDSGKIVVVMASQGMAIAMDMSMMGSMQGMAGATPPTFSGITATLDDKGAADKILGMATHKYLQHTSYTMTSAQKGVVKVDASSEMFMTTELPGMADGLQKFADSFAGAFNGIMGGGAKEMADALKGKTPKGFAMKVLVTSKETNAAGVTSNSTTTVEVTEFSKSTFEATDFEVPAGIQVMDMAAMMGGRGGH